jgi:RNA polymerase sigma-70 factor, ECF subfamily
MTADSPTTLDVQAFEEQRPLLFGVAYRMLGSAMEAEDIVQEAFLRARTVDTAGLRSLSSYLVTIVTRLCLDHLKSAHAQREQYVGPWLPEPIRTGSDAPAGSPESAVTAKESISFAFLVLLESLGPIERAVFLLREVFDYGYDEVAAMVGRTEVACRQTFKRAKQHLDERRPRFQPTAQQRQRLTEHFLLAVGAGDMQGLLGLLADDITVWSDGGGKAAAAINPIHGPDRVARFFFGITRKEAHLLQVGSVAIEEINGGPATVFRGPHGGVWSVLFIEMEKDGRVSELRLVRNPDKLRRLRRQHEVTVV